MYNDNNASTPPTVPYGGQPVAGATPEKEFTTAVILTWLLGGLGIDRFYLGYTGLGLGKLFTFGGLGVWSLIDAIMITTGKVPDAQGRPLRR
jgi:TM2 domain-containing membrane protein YozV